MTKNNNNNKTKKTLKAEKKNTKFPLSQTKQDPNEVLLVEKQTNVHYVHA